MEPYSHLQPQITTKKPPISSKNGEFFNNSYHNIYGDHPRYPHLAPRPQDYSDIFGAFQSSSSIPVLDLPEVFDVDIGVSVFDYSDIFGDLNDADFAVHYDELFRSFDDCSSEEAWTPVGSGSLSDDSDPFAISDKSRCFSHEDSHQPLDNKHFDDSCHKGDPGPSTYTANMTHVAQYSDVHGNVCVDHESAALREMGAKRVCSEAVDDIVFDVSSSIMPHEHKRNIASEVSLDDSGLKSFDTVHMHERASVASMLDVKSTFTSASDVFAMTEQLHMPPSSRLPPKGTVDGLSSGFKASYSCAPEATVDGGMPPCFFMGIEESASTPAIKEVMEKAGTEHEAGKELMSGKKDGHQDTLELDLKTGVNGEENVPRVLNECAFRGNETQKCVSTASQLIPDISSVECPNIAIEKSAVKKHWKKCSLSVDTAFTEGGGECKIVTNDTSRLVPQPPNNGHGKIATLKQPRDEYDGECYSDSAVEGSMEGGNKQRLKATQTVSSKKYYEKLVKATQWVHDSVISACLETDQRLIGMSPGNCKEQNAKFGNKSENYVEKTGQVLQAGEEESRVATGNEEAEIRSKNVLEEEDVKNNCIKKKEHGSCHLEQNAKKTYGLHQSQIKENPGREDEDTSVQEDLSNAEDDKKMKEVYGRQRMENKLEDVVEESGKEKMEVMRKRLKEPFEDRFGGEELQASCRIQDHGQTEELKKEDKISKEGLVYVFDEERLQLTNEVQGIDNRNDLLQRDEDEKYLDDLSFERIIEECVVLGDHREYNEAPELAVRKPGEDELNNLVNANTNSREGLTCDNHEEKFEKSTDEVAFEGKKMKVDEVLKILRKTDGAENQDSVCSSHIEIECEDQKSDGFSEMKFPLENENLMSYGGANLHGMNVENRQDTLTSELKNQLTGDHSQDVFTQNVTVVPDEECNLKAVDTAAVLVGEKLSESMTTPLGTYDDDHEKSDFASDSADWIESNIKSVEFSDRIGQKVKDENKKVSQPVSDPKLLQGSNNIEQAGGKRILGEGSVFSDQDEIDKSIPVEGINGWTEHAGEKAGTYKVMTESNNEAQKIFDLTSLSQRSEPKGKITDQSCSFEKKDEEERELEEKLRKLENEKEREKERENDRMAIEIGIHEAQERAYANACEQAEKAAFERSVDEARQRAMTEARGRLEMVCAEARQRSVDNEAKLRAERVAVERATAGTHQHAVEIAVAETATFEAREVQRSLSEKYAIERDVRRQSLMPSMQNEPFEAADVEPVQTCRSRLERHRRTVERVAKALADKNMHDILVQREQAERKRLSEILDADIERWSSGKEGNLQALLSTLQYIFGPNSGWQPIPLSEVVTAAAVKTAYRKATLYVHPDKLQQRGASIQQKYICEKVFDLLKEAWNKFNSEEE